MPKKLTSKEFIEKAIQVHGDKYGYKRVKYKNIDTKVAIICKVHKLIFFQTPYSHLIGKGCKKCSDKATGDRFRYSKEKAIAKARAIHGDKYGYGDVDYVNSKTKSKIWCAIHKEYFYQSFSRHMAGAGCKKCANLLIGNNIRSSKEEFIAKARKIHGDKYDYDEFIYRSAIEKGNIKCRIHNIIFKQSPNKHLQYNGCPICKSSKGEFTIANMLTKNNINFIQEYKLPELSDYNFRYDFYLPDHHLLIEFHGMQHYHPIEFFGGEKALENRKRNDKIKRYLAKKTGYRIIYFNYLQFKKYKKTFGKFFIDFLIKYLNN